MYTNRWLQFVGRNIKDRTIIVSGYADEKKIKGKEFEYLTEKISIFLLKTKSILYNHYSCVAVIHSDRLRNGLRRACATMTLVTYLIFSVTTKNAIHHGQTMHGRCQDYVYLVYLNQYEKQPQYFTVELLVLP